MPFEFSDEFPLIAEPLVTCIGDNIEQLLGSLNDGLMVGGPLAFPGGL